MKIAIPCEGTNLQSNVSQSFGRCEYFVVVDTDTNKFEVIDNTAISSEGGAGIKASQSVVDSGAKAVITFHLGQNAADVLNAADVKILKAVPGDIENVVAKFKSNQLEVLTEIHPGYHNHGGK
jgi:predicted Fe-Mo cluster-binding NifX family protein